MNEMICLFMLVIMVMLHFRFFVMNQRFVLDLLDDCLEPVNRICSVLYNACATIGIEQSVGSLHDISVPFFPVGLVISGMGILYSVVELVLGVCEVIVGNFDVVSVVLNLVVLLRLLVVFLLLRSVHSIRRNGNCHTGHDENELVKEEIEHLLAN